MTADPSASPPASSETKAASRGRGAIALRSEQLWGEAVQTSSPALEKHLRELQAELIGLATDVRRGPLERHLGEATEYLGALRREFLRHHRRLLVQTRTDDREHVPELLRTELAELTDRLRGVVLGRSSKMLQEGWRPGKLVAALERTMEILPESIEAQYETASFSRQPSDPLPTRIGRALLRFKIWVRKLARRETERTVELQSLARFHLAGTAMDRVEGLAALFVQADVQIVAHSRMILEGIVRGFDTLREYTTEGDLQEVLATFRQQVDEEFALAEKEVGRLVEDAARRAARILGEGLKAIKDDLAIAGTFELPNRRRRADRIVHAQQLGLADLEGRMGRVRESISASYVLLGLHLEYASYRARVRVVLGRQLSELRKDVRGRSHTQIERVMASLDETLTALAAEGEDGAPSEAALRTCFEPLERVLSEAMRAANQLLEQLTEEQLVAPLLDALNREAQNLTDRYSVPAGKLPHAEWKLPAPLAMVEVPLADLVAAYTQTTIAPDLLQVTHAAVSVAQPVVSALHDVERIVSIDAEHLDPEVELGLPETDETPGDLRDVAIAALTRSRASLEEVLDHCDTWSDELTEQLKQVVLSGVDGLRGRLSETEIAHFKAGRGRGTPKVISRQVDRFTTFLNWLGDESWRRVRQVAGEERIGRWRGRLGLQEADVPPEEVADRLAPLSPRCEIPLFYRRLFAANAHWAGDLSPEKRRGVERFKRVLGRQGGGVLRTCAIVSPDGTGQGALLAAITRGDRHNQIRRISFSRPVSLQEVEALFTDLGQGQLLVVGGFHWLLGAGPGGFEPVRRFLAGVLADAGRNAWVLEAATFVWRYACKVAPVAEVFGERVMVAPLSPAALEAALMSRHQLSGLEARFSTEPKGSAVEASSKEHLFGEIHRLSGGLLIRALPVWIASIAAVNEDEGVARLGNPPPSPMPALHALDEEIWVVLHAISRQGWMDRETLAYLFRWDAVAAEGTLMRLAGEGIVDRKGHGHYQVRRHLQHGVQRILRERGWGA